MGPLNPEIDEFQRAVRSLAKHPIIGRCLVRGELLLEKLSRDEVRELIRDDVSRYFLMAAAGLNRTSLKKAVLMPEVQVLPADMRRAHVIRQRLPAGIGFEAAAQQAVALRSGDLTRRVTGAVEGHFRERLAAEGIPLAMSPPIRHVPGLLVPKRKPDGVYPDPETGLPPEVYLEIKNIRRVGDDIQKRLYELAEASLEMKILYGNLQLRGLNLRSTDEVEQNASLRGRVRQQIAGVRPIVVGFFICSRAEAERYREGAEAFVDRIFFQEEIDECLRFLRSAIH